MPYVLSVDGWTGPSIQDSILVNLTGYILSRVEFSLNLLGSPNHNVFWKKTVQSLLKGVRIQSAFCLEVSDLSLGVDACIRSSGTDQL